MQGVIGAFRDTDATVAAIQELKRKRVGRHHGVHAGARSRRSEEAIDAGPASCGGSR